MKNTKLGEGIERDETDEALSYVIKKVLQMWHLN